MKSRAKKLIRKIFPRESQGGSDASSVSPTTAGEIYQSLVRGDYPDSELVIALVHPVGTDHQAVVQVLEVTLELYGYRTEVVHISKQVMPGLAGKSLPKGVDEFDRINRLIEWGNQIREKSGRNEILALGAAARIFAQRCDGHPEPLKNPMGRRAFIITSLKRPEEVEILRKIYSDGFFLFGVFSDDTRRRELLGDRNLTPEQIEKLIRRDADEGNSTGQETSKTFQMADFFLHLGNNIDRVRKDILRFLKLMFGHPYTTPTFDEYAMFMAFSASLRSADLSRQVGAVIAKEKEIFATGANDCPKFGGGLYWPEIEGATGETVDHPNGRDHTRGCDSNKVQKEAIIKDVINHLDGLPGHPDPMKAIERSKLKDITEYGRIVHAEMEALLCCARNNNSPRDGTLYCTTFPCHNCAKHLIAAGIRRVVFVEPYPKSKALEFHSEAVIFGIDPSEKRVSFEPFVGVGPRRFFDLFSMSLGSGYPLVRKDTSGKVLPWITKGARLRTQLLPASYMDKECLAADMVREVKESLHEEEDRS